MLLLIALLIAQCVAPEVGPAASFFTFGTIAQDLENFIWICKKIYGKRIFSLWKS